MEEPNIHLAGIQRGGAAQLDVEFFVEIFNKTVQGLRELTEVWCHTCWGNPAALIRRALEHIPVERLILSTDCGFGREGMSRRIAFYKMVSIVRGANLVRRELGLPEAECRAADARFALVEEI